MRNVKKIRFWRILRIALLGLAVWWFSTWCAAKALICHENIPQADVIVVLGNASAYIERTHQAAALWKAQRAPRILLTNENLRSGWSEAQQRNPFFYERATAELERSGVTPEQIEVLPQPVDSTYDEARLLKDYATEHKLRSIIIVTSAYHSRRALWVFRQVLKGLPLNVGIDPVPPGDQTPEPATWWLRPTGWRIVALEYPKLVYYWLRYRDSEQGDRPRSVRSGSVESAPTTVGATSAGMTLKLNAPTTAYVNEAILLDSRNSIGVARAPQPDGTPSITIDFGDGSQCNLLACGHAYRTAGRYTVTVSARNEKGITASPVRATIDILPIMSATKLNINDGEGQNSIDMTNPQGNKSYFVQAGSNARVNGTKLQNAVNFAALHNTVEQEIILPAGAVFAGPIILPTPVGNRYITIRSGSLSLLPASGNRVSLRDAGQMPTITAPSSSSGELAAIGTANIAPVNPPHHYRIQGIHVRKDDENNPSAFLMNFGIDGNGGQNAVSKVPHHFIVDRCFVDGGAGAMSQVTTGIRVYANSVSIVDSYVGEMRLVGSGADTSAIAIASGHGPYAVVNNTLIATSENFFVGGGTSEANKATVSHATTNSCTLTSTTNLELDQNIAFKVGGAYGPDQTTIVRAINGNNITFDPIPAAPDNGSAAEWCDTISFIEFRRNYVYKPLSWRPTDPSWNGQKYQIKNLWEIKFGRYIVVDGNVLQNQWIAAQDYAITITVRNRWGGFSVASVVRELQFSNNIFKNLANGVVILSSDRDDGITQRTSDITFRNNLFWNVGVNWDSACCGHMLINLMHGGSPTDVAKRIFLIHNTHDNGMPNNSNGMITDFGDDGGATESMWLNNVHQHGGAGFRSSISATDSAANISRFLPPGDATNWHHNLIVNKGGARYPRAGIYVTGPWPQQFVDYSGGDFTLVQSSRGKRAAADTTDIGVDMARLKAATAGTISGVWTATTNPASGK